MEFQISNKMKDLKGSIIRELFKLASDPNIIAFGGGNPSPLSFPTEEIAEITAKVLADNPVSVLQYGLSEGYTPLRETLTAYLKDKMQIGMPEDRLLIVSGSQQAADITAKCLVNEGDVVICEDPSFIGCLNTFRSYGAKLIGIPMESDGMNLEKLAEALEANPNVKLIYTIPTFQNPSGITTSLEKRQEIYRLAKEYSVPIMEDNPYGELRFKGVDVPTLKSIDTDGLVIYCGSFSKVMAPAFRVGFVVVNEKLFGRMVIGKQTTDVHTNVLFQHICHEYMTKYDFAGHIEENRRLYGAKCTLMLTEMEKKFHPAVTFTHPEGGMFIMAYLPEGYDSEPFVKEAIKQGVAVIPGVAFLADSNGTSNAFRLNFSTPSDEHIIKGIDILGRLTYQWLS